MASRILASVCAIRDADLSRSRGTTAGRARSAYGPRHRSAARTSESTASMRASIVGASERDAPAARAAMRHLTACGISSRSGRRSRRISVGVDPPVSHDPGSFEGKPNEDAALDAPDTGLKIRVSLVQFRPWAPVSLAFSSEKPRFWPLPASRRSRQERHPRQEFPGPDFGGMLLADHRLGVLARPEVPQTPS